MSNDTITKEPLATSNDVAPSDQWQDYDQFKTSNDHVSEYYQAVQTCHAEALAELVRSKVAHGLDIASGHGETSKLLLNFAEQVVGVDSSEDLITKAKMCQTPNLNFVCSSFEEYQPSTKFDLISATWFLNHVHSKQDLEATFEKIKSMLNPGGCVSFVTPSNSFTSANIQKIALSLFQWRQAWFEEGDGYTRGVLSYYGQWIPTTIWEPVFLMRMLDKHFDVQTWDVKQTQVEHRLLTDFNVEPPFEVIYGTLR